MATLHSMINMLQCGPPKETFTALTKSGKSKSSALAL